MQLKETMDETKFQKECQILLANWKHQMEKAGSCKEKAEYLLSAWMQFGQIGHQEHAAISDNSKFLICSTLNMLLDPAWTAKTSEGNNAIDNNTKGALLHHLGQVKNLVQSNETSFAKNPWEDLHLRPILMGDATLDEVVTFFNVENSQMTIWRITFLLEYGRIPWVRNYCRMSMQFQNCVQIRLIDEAEKAHVAYVYFAALSKNVLEVCSMFKEMPLERGMEYMRLFTNYDNICVFRPLGKSRIKRGLDNAIFYGINTLMSVSMLYETTVSKTILQSILDEWTRQMIDKIDIATVRKVVPAPCQSFKIYLFVTHLLNFPNLKDLCVELYIRALNVNMNELQYLVMDIEKKDEKIQQLRLEEFDKEEEIRHLVEEKDSDKAQLKECRLQLAGGFITFSNMFPDHLYMKAEFLLTAFYLNPDADVLEGLATAFQSHWREHPCPGQENQNGADQLQMELALTMRAMETGEEKMPRKCDCFREALIAEVESLNMTADQLQALNVILKHPRAPPLSWIFDWDSLVKNCGEYQENFTGLAEEGVVLEYLDVAYRKKRIDTDDDDDSDVPGVEKGYEHYIEVSPEQKVKKMKRKVDDEESSGDEQPYKKKYRKKSRREEDEWKCNKHYTKLENEILSSQNRELTPRKAREMVGNYGENFSDVNFGTEQGKNAKRYLYFSNSSSDYESDDMKFEKKKRKKKKYKKRESNVMREKKKTGRPKKFVTIPVIQNAKPIVPVIQNDEPAVPGGLHAEPIVPSDQNGESHVKVKNIREMSRERIFQLVKSQNPDLPFTTLFDKNGKAIGYKILTPDVGRFDKVSPLRKHVMGQMKSAQQPQSNSQEQRKSQKQFEQEALVHIHSKTPEQFQSKAHEQFQSNMQEQFQSKSLEQPLQQEKFQPESQEMRVQLLPLSLAEDNRIVNVEGSSQIQSVNNGTKYKQCVSKPRGKYKPRVKKPNPNQLDGLFPKDQHQRIISLEPLEMPQPPVPLLSQSSGLIHSLLINGNNVSAQDGQQKVKRQYKPRVKDPDATRKRPQSLLSQPSSSQFLFQPSGSNDSYLVPPNILLKHPNFSISASKPMERLAVPPPSVSFALVSASTSKMGNVRRKSCPVGNSCNIFGGRTKQKTSIGLHGNFQIPTDKLNPPERKTFQNSAISAATFSKETKFPGSKPTEKTHNGKIAQKRDISDGFYKNTTIPYKTIKPTPELDQERRRYMSQILSESSGKCVIREPRVSEMESYLTRDSIQTSQRSNSSYKGNWGNSHNNSTYTTINCEEIGDLKTSLQSSNFQSCNSNVIIDRSIHDLLIQDNGMKNLKDDAHGEGGFPMLDSDIMSILRDSNIAVVDSEPLGDMKAPHMDDEVISLGDIYDVASDLSVVELEPDMVPYPNPNMFRAFVTNEDEEVSLSDYDSPSSSSNMDSVIIEPGIIPYWKLSPCYAHSRI